MIDIVELRFKKNGKKYFFSPNGINVIAGDKLLVETIKGLEIATAVSDNFKIKSEKLKEIIGNNELKSIIRIGTNEDMDIFAENKVLAKKALAICKEKSKKYNLGMTIIDCEYTFDRTKVLFYFYASGRVDFRDFVKELASIFKVRIELRQVGVRDEARVVDGIGSCGRKLCCSSWMNEFKAVSVQMAKDQGVNISPSKISGSCGRLQCCLKYEYDNYYECKKTLPQNGDIIKHNKDKYLVTNVHYLNQNFDAIKIEKMKGDEIVKLSNDNINIPHNMYKMIKRKNISEECCKDARELKELKELERD